MPGAHSEGRQAYRSGAGRLQTQEGSASYASWPAKGQGVLPGSEAGAGARNGCHLVAELPTTGTDQPVQFSDCRTSE